jgi:exosortase
LSAVLAAVALWLVAYGGNSAIGIQLVAPLLIASTIWFVHGQRMLLRVIAPILFLYFASPAWELLVPPLQTLCVAVVEGTLRQLGIPVAIEGVVVHIAAGSFAVVEDCSGIRFLMISLAITFLMTFAYRLRPKSAVALLAAGAALSIVGNWLRIIVVVLAGHFSDMQHYLVATEHASLGWAIFLAVIAGVALIGARMPAAAPKPEPTAASARAVELRASLAAAAVALVALAAIPLAVLYRSNLPPVQLVEAGLPVLDGSFSGPHPAAAVWTPAYPTAAVATLAAYRGADGTVELFVAEYGAQEPGRELTHHSNRLADASWNVIAAEPARDIGAAVPLRVRRYATPEGPEWLVSYFFDVGGFRTASSATAQIAYGIASWFGPVRSRVVAAAVECSRDCGSARLRLAAFWDRAALALGVQKTEAERTPHPPPRIAQ